MGKSEKIAITISYIFTKHSFNMSRLVVLLSVIGFVVSSASECAVSDASKLDCGFVGIDQSGCENKGCCWATSSSNVPWCFYQAGGASSCFGNQVLLFLC
jgi:hypothetical protein